MYLRRSTTLKYLIAAIVGAALYCEWFNYIIQAQYWQRLECEDQNASCTKVLFVADPQIQGDLAVPPPLSYLFNWDSDRYLKSTFTVVQNHFKPDVVVFLGDLMDEGSVATMTQFHSYGNRLSNIFDMHNLSQDQIIWLPGDNDIGGENYEPIKKDKVAEFEKQPSIIKFRNITFYKVNMITHTYPKRAAEDNNLKIVVSHYPVTIRQSIGQKVNIELQPDIYFCAHEHSSKYVKQKKDLSHREIHLYEYGEKVLNIHFDGQTLYEIYVPTCSYRMGTSKIGYGAAILENHNQQMRYTVFWSPKRFPYLFFYLAVLMFLIIYFLIFCASRLLHRCLKKTPASIDKQPLLERI